MWFSVAFLVISWSSANSPSPAPLKPSSSGAAVLRAQVLLARAHFSPGEIDAYYGSTTAAALAAFRAENQLPAGDTIDAALWQALERQAADTLVQYTLTRKDVAGPFKKVPTDMMAKAKLPHLGYASALEALAEKFHCSPKLLKQMNPKTAFRPGRRILVPNVTGLPALPKAESVVVTASEHSVRALDAAGKTIAWYPATMGSEHDPLPLGEWKVKGIARNPTFHYNPDLFWDASPDHSKTAIRPGPNNPVGVVWIDLSAEHYGIHGTPEPSQIGRTESHGCIRLTNWDASELAGLLAPGKPAILRAQ